MPRASQSHATIEDRRLEAFLDWVPHHVPFGRQMRSRSARYGSAIVLVAVATLARQLLRGVLVEAGYHYITYYPVTFFIALAAGTGPGLLATLLSTLCADYYFVEPFGLGNFGIAQTVGSLLFSATGVGISLLAGATKRANLALAQGQARLRGLLEAVPEAILEINEEGRIMLVNRVAEQIFGFTRHELLALNVDALVPEVQRHEHARHRMDYAAQPVTRPMGSGLPLKAARKDGSTFPVEISLSPNGRGNTIALVRDITERERAEADLLENEAKFRTLTQLVPQLVWMSTPDGSNVYFNQRWVDYTGLTLEESSGNGWNTPFHPEDKKRAWDAWHRAVARGEDYRVESRIRAADGTYRWFLVLGVPLRDPSGNVSKWFGTCTDIEELKQAQEQILKLSGRLKLAASLFSLGVWEWDLRSNTLIWDDVMRRIYGFDKTDPVTVQSAIAAVHPDDRPRVREWMQRVIRRETRDPMGFRVIRPDGSVRNIDAACHAIGGASPETARILGLNIDVTDRKILEAQIEANRTHLVTSARLASLGMMAGGVAHEINNPLAIIHALAADLLETAKADGHVPVEAVIETSQEILHTSERIAKITEGMRHLAREGSKDRLKPAVAAKIIQDALAVCRDSFKKHSVKLIAPRLDPALRVLCREVQISQVLLNLFQNALDAVRQQHGDRWIRLDVAVRDNWVVFSVIDSGPGIPPEFRTRIMEPFFTTKEVGSGTGLGLSVSRTIVEEHGGKLEFTEEDGHTCFTFNLPLVPSEATA